MIPDCLNPNLDPVVQNAKYRYTKEPSFTIGQLHGKYYALLVVKSHLETFFHPQQMKRYIPAMGIHTPINKDKGEAIPLFFIYKGSLKKGPLTGIDLFSPV